MNAMTQQPTEAVRIHARAMLVNLNISQWTARKTDRKATKDVAESNHVVSTQGAYYKSLVEGGALDDIKALVNQARAEHYKRTLPWSDNGPRILSNFGYLDYITKMNAYADQFDALVNVFLSEYPQMRLEARRLLGSLFEDNDYPSVGAVHCKFNFKVSITPLPMGDDFRCDLGTEEVDRIREEITNGTAAALQQAQRDAFERVEKVVNSYIERLGDPDNKFRDSLVDNARELAELLPALNIINNPLLADLADSLMNKLCAHEPSVLREDPISRQETFMAAKSMHKDIMDFFSGEMQ